MPKVNNLQQFILMERQQRNNLAAFNLLVKKDDPIGELRGYLNDNNNRSNIFHIDDLKYGQPTDADLTLMTSRLKLLQTSFDDLSIPKPFKNSSEEVDIELKFIRMLRKLSEDPETTRNIDEEDKDLLAPFLRFAKTHNLPVDESFLRLLLHDVNALTIRFKYMFNRPRPKQLAAQKKLELVAHEGESANIPSYPSGHSVAGRVIGKALGDRYPSFAKGFEKIGAAIGLHRLIAGLHYPTDHAAGVMLGDQIYSKGLINNYTNFMMPESEDLVRAVQQAVAKHAEGFNLNKSIDDMDVLVDIFKANEKTTMFGEVIDDRTVTVHSGGADGSDDAWAKAFPDEVIGHSFEDHNMFNRTNRKIWDDDRLEQNFQKYLDAYSWIKSNGDPGRPRVSNDKTKKLMSRNWEQVRNSDAVIGIIEELIGNAPTGGTSYAVAMGIQKGIPVHVFNQKTSSWLTWNPRDNKWDGTSLNDIPHYKSFAGVGSRKLGAKGKAAIQAYAGKLKTFQKEEPFKPFFTPGTAPNQQFGSTERENNIFSGSPDPMMAAFSHWTTRGNEKWDGSPSSNRIGTPDKFPVEIDDETYEDLEEYYGVKIGGGNYHKRKEGKARPPLGRIDEAQKNPVNITGWVPLSPEEKIEIMTKANTAKFKQYPELVDYIKDNGGLGFLAGLEHHYGRPASRDAFSDWVGKGARSWNVQVLARAYAAVVGKREVEGEAEVPEDDLGEFIAAMDLPGTEDYAAPSNNQYANVNVHFRDSPKVFNRPEPVDDGLRHIYVFGSNSLGVHGNGTALIAVKHHGARYNQSWPKDLQALNAEGIQGELDTAGSYALLTKKEPYITYSREQLTEPTGTVRNSIRTFIKFAIENPTMVNSDGVEQKVVYHIADVGTNPRGAGFKPEEVARVFREETSPTRLAALGVGLNPSEEGRVSVEGGEVGTVTLTDAEREKRRTVAAAIVESLSRDATDKVFIFGDRLAGALGIEYSDEDYNNYGIRGRVGDSIQHPKYDAEVEKIERDRAAKEKKPKTVEQLKQEEHLKKRVAQANARLSRAIDATTVHQVGEARQGFSPEQEIREEPHQFERGGKSLSDQVSELQPELEDFIKRNYDSSRWLFIDNSTYKQLLGIGRQTIKPGESKGEIKPEKIKGTVFDTEIEDVAQQIAMHTVLGSRVGERGMLHIAQRPSNTQVMNFLNRKIHSGDEEERIDMEPILNAEDVTLDHIIEYMTIERIEADDGYNTDPYQVLAEDVSLHPVQDAPGQYNLSFTAANYAIGNPWMDMNPAGSIAHDYDTGIISQLRNLAWRGDNGGRDMADTVETLITDIRSLLTSGEGLEGLRELKDQVAEVAHDKIGDQKSNWPTAGVSERAQVDSALDDLMNSTTYEERIEAYRQEEELDLAEVTAKFLEDFKKDINLLAIGTPEEEEVGKLSQSAVFQAGLLNPKFNFDREALKRLLMFSSLYGAYNPSKQSFTQNNIAGNVRKNLGALMKQVRERWESENKAARPTMDRPRSMEELEKEQLERQKDAGDGAVLEAEKGERADLQQEWDDYTEAWGTFNERPTLSDTNSEINKLLFNWEWWSSKKGKANKDNRKIWTDLFIVEPIKDVETRFPDLQRNFLVRLDAIQKRMSEGYYDAREDTWPGAFTLADAELFGELLGFPGITEAFKATGVNAVAGEVNRAVLDFVYPGSKTKGRAKAHPEFREIFAGFGTPLTKVREQSFIDEMEEWELPGVEGFEALLESGALNEETIKAMNRNADSKVVEEILRRASANDTLKDSGVDDINSLITYTAAAFKGNQFKQDAGAEAIRDESGDLIGAITPYFADPPIHAPRLQRYSVDEQQAHRIIDYQLENYFKSIFKDGALLSEEERFGTVDETTGGERRYTSGDAEGMLVEPQRDISRIGGKIESTVEQQLDDLRSEIFGPGETVEETLDRSYNDLVDSGEVDEETGEMIQIPRSDLFLREAKKLLLSVAKKKGVDVAHLDTTPGLQILLAGTPEARKQLAEDREKILEDLDRVDVTKKNFPVGGVPKTTVAGAEAKLRTSAGEVDTFYYHDPASLATQGGEPTPDITPDEILADIERMQSYATVPESDIRGLKELGTPQINKKQVKEWIKRTFGSHDAFLEVARLLNEGRINTKEAGVLFAKRANEVREKVLPVIQDVETEQQVPMLGEGEATEPTVAMREQQKDAEEKAAEARKASWLPGTGGDIKPPPEVAPSPSLVTLEGETDAEALRRISSTSLTPYTYRYGQATKWPRLSDFQRSNTASSAMKDPAFDVDPATIRSKHPFKRAETVRHYDDKTGKPIGTYEEMSQQESSEGTKNAP